MAEQNGENYSIMNYGQFVALQCLYLIKYGNLNSQVALGKGLTEADNSVSMGGTIDKGMYYGSSTNGLQQMKFAGIEDLWGNAHEWCKGFETDDVLTYTITYGNETITVSSGHEEYPLVIGYISKVLGNTESGFAATEVEGDETTYYTDETGLFPHGALSIGANYNTGASGGIFFLGIYDVDETAERFGARLTYL